MNYQLQSKCPHLQVVESGCVHEVGAGFCRRDDHFICDERVRTSIEARGPEGHVEVCSDVNELARIAGAISTAGCVGLHVVIDDDEPETSPRALALCVGHGPIHLVDLFATGGLGALDQALRCVQIIGHDLKPQLAALAWYLRREPLDLFDTQLGARLLDAGMHSGRERHGLGDVLQRHLGVRISEPELRWGGFISNAHCRAAGHKVMYLLPLAHMLAEELSSENLTAIANIENDVLPAIVEMEVAGVPASFQHWKILVASRDARAKELENRLHVELGVKNLRNASDVRRALSLVTGHDLHRTAPADLAPFFVHTGVRALVEFRRHAALLEQLGWPLLEQLADGDGRVRCDFDQLGSATGRLTATRPNMFGVPKVAEVRSCFRAVPGRVLVDADYSAIELRVLAEVSQDESLIQLFHAGDDPHRRTAARMTGKKADEVTEAERNAAKPANFGICYGMGPDGLAESALEKYGVEMTHDEASAWIDAFFAEYPRVSQWRHGVSEDAEPCVRTLGGRTRFVPQDRLPARLATIVQGTAADGMKQAIAGLYTRLKAVDARIVLVLHDELLVECNKENADTVMAIVRAGMIDGMAKYVTSVPVEVKVKVSQSWGG